ncbi:MAG TPA: RdgB/HAM1 family non-canonical purine NTP pyrophosphatase [Verrucomicrobia bacterium]|nr:RdgB/HAM1 family non-canonical purine NTP pyrophosphatase [Verrucomicrobiales bacterium]HIL54860.1 RdgB/HAM1 family non-canonical purine NTP pyrophosphatase [Verrucomicrobiota bacterium]
MNRLIIATGNTHKTEEIRKLLGSIFESIEDLQSYPEIGEIGEIGSTFGENAELKAIEVGKLLGNSAIILSDDSGLEVDALNGAPGVRSARFSGKNANDASNRKKLLDELEEIGVHGEFRVARFRCVMVLARGDQTLAVFNGVVEGKIADKEKGESGFGYDSIFIPQGYDKTFAELPSHTKNTISHRANALAAFKTWLLDPDSVK